jgi:hypothetical protein
MNRKQEPDVGGGGMDGRTHERPRCHRSRWRRALESAATTAEILATLRDFLATLTPAELARIPEECRPLRIKAEDDVEYWTFRLAQLIGSPPAEPVDAKLAQRILNVFLHAIVQIIRVQKSQHPAASWAPSRPLPFEALQS